MCDKSHVTLLKMSVFFLFIHIKTTMQRLNLKQTIRENFPVFDNNLLVEALIDNCQYFKLPADTELMHMGSYITVVPLVISGTIKVFREDEKGREVFLYYIKAGESCALTMTACFKMEKSYIKAKIQEDTEFIAIPVELVRNFHKKHPSWSKFVFSTFSKRFDDILRVLESVVFHNMDERLSIYLTEKATALENNTIYSSHKAIADDLVTSREVISRLLKQMEKKGLVELSRGKIKLICLLDKSNQQKTLLKADLNNSENLNMIMKTENDNGRANT